MDVFQDSWPGFLTASLHEYIPSIVRSDRTSRTEVVCLSVVLVELELIKLESLKMAETF